MVEDTTSTHASLAKFLKMQLDRGLTWNDLKDSVCSRVSPVTLLT